MAVRRSITSVRLQTSFGIEHGVSVAECLSGTGITEAMLNQADATITADQELAMVHNLCNAMVSTTESSSGNTTENTLAELGLAMGQRYHLSSYGVWGFALLSSPTFQQAVDLGLRYLDLTFAFLEMRLENHDNNAILVLDDSKIPEPVRHYLLARDASALMMIQEELFANRIPFSSLKLRLPSQNTAPFEKIFGLTPSFDQTVNQAQFSAGLLAMPLPQANPITAQMCEQQCQQLLAQRYQQGRIAVKVRQQLLQHVGHFPNMELLAENMAITSRTLRRQLQNEGTSYRELLDEVRQMLAEQWLTLEGLNQEQISERLGYSEVSNFSHAFKRWTGKTPAQFRNNVRE
jgi:AraC-like DNA-binding protein